MADKKEETKSALQTFKETLHTKKNVADIILEGIKSKDARVRSLAAKVAFKTQKYDFIKKNVLPLMNSDKSKKVLRTIGNKITRKDLNTKLEGLIKKKVAGGKKAAAKPAEEAPKAG